MWSLTITNKSAQRESVVGSYSGSQFTLCTSQKPQLCKAAGAAQTLSNRRRETVHAAKNERQWQSEPEREKHVKKCQHFVSSTEYFTLHLHYEIWLRRNSSTYILAVYPCTHTLYIGTQCTQTHTFFNTHSFLNLIPLPSFTTFANPSHHTP